MPPKRRQQTDKNREVDSMPELEELPADEEHREMSVQNMVDRIEGHSHGHAIAKQPAESHEEIQEKNTVEMEEVYKMMAEGILVYVKAVVSHITQSKTQGSFKHKGVEQGVGSSRAGETRRSIPTPPSLDEMYTPPHQKDEAIFHRSPVMVRGNGNGNSRPHLQQPYSVTNPMIQPGLFEELRREAFGTEIIHKEENNEEGQLRLDDLVMAPAQMEDSAHEVQDPVEEVNLGSPDNPKVPLPENPPCWKVFDADNME
ncbi:hypothetical protein F511_18710 [Dorcoceras hygrometricum]|uniref:Uncharacterized protein n=1 Tax=Dorcoceras hygrometricum TaxID=472368 RepID=A0A2Z7BW57_9LAMI|nr:hypothetical protein F511_18710 [Dorcoceras hygrometricum]